MSTNTIHPSSNKNVYKREPMMNDYNIHALVHGMIKRMGFEDVDNDTIKSIIDRNLIGGIDLSTPIIVDGGKITLN